jgi:DNA gyrase inhibitor GyrI
VKIALYILGGLTLLGIAGMAVFVYVVQNVETPSYATVLKDGAFEIRDYPPLVVAEVRRQGGRQESLSQGFGPLARYIFAKERPGERIAMTAPVIQQRSESIAMTAPVTQTKLDGGDWAVRFIMPARYRLADLPAPAGKDVQLVQIPAQRSAAIRFSGRSTDAVLVQREVQLRAWMAARGLEPAAPPVFAYYNDPFTPGPLRRNEVLIDLATDPTAEALAP